MILPDLLKQRFNAGHLPNLYFWRDKSGCEIDWILDEGTKLIPIEIKSGATINSDYLSNLLKWNKLSETNPLNNYVIYGGIENQARSSGSVISWQNLDEIKET